MEHLKKQPKSTKEKLLNDLRESSSGYYFWCSRLVMRERERRIDAPSML